MMFQELQASGVLLCYVPLALVIGGFIAFAALTDKISTSTYLRRLDPRPESEREDTPIPVDRPLRAVTPSGLTVAVLPEEEKKAEKKEAPKEEAAVTEPSASAPEPDDLTRVEGIGPKIKSVLAEAGIVTFSQLASTKVDVLGSILAEANMSGVNDPSTWPEQATLAAEGKWEELDKLQDELKGGRRV